MFEFVESRRLRNIGLRGTPLTMYYNSLQEHPILSNHPSVYSHI